MQLFNEHSPTQITIDMMKKSKVFGYNDEDGNYQSDNTIQKIEESIKFCDIYCGFSAGPNNENIKRSIWDLSDPLKTNIIGKIEVNDPRWNEIELKNEQAIIKAYASYCNAQGFEKTTVLPAWKQSENGKEIIKFGSSPISKDTLYYYTMGMMNQALTMSWIRLSKSLSGMNGKLDYVNEALGDELNAQTWRADAMSVLEVGAKATFNDKGLFEKADNTLNNLGIFNQTMLENELNSNTFDFNKYPNGLWGTMSTILYNGSPYSMLSHVIIEIHKKIDLLIKKVNPTSMDGMNGEESGEKTNVGGSEVVNSQIQNARKNVGFTDVTQNVGGDYHTEKMAFSNFILEEIPKQNKLIEKDAVYTKILDTKDMWQKIIVVFTKIGGNISSALQYAGVVRKAVALTPLSQTNLDEAKRASKRVPISFEDFLHQIKTTGPLHISGRGNNLFKWDKLNTEPEFADKFFNDWCKKLYARLDGNPITMDDILLWDSFSKQAQNRTEGTGKIDATWSLRKMCQVNPSDSSIKDIIESMRIKIIEMGMPTFWNVILSGKDKNINIKDFICNEILEKSNLDKNFNKNIELLDKVIAENRIQPNDGERSHSDEFKAKQLAKIQKASNPETTETPNIEDSSIDNISNTNTEGSDNQVVNDNSIIPQENDDFKDVYTTAHPDDDSSDSETSDFKEIYDSSKK